MTNQMDSLSVHSINKEELELAKGLLASGRTLVLTGAGISTDSGIPDYRGQGKIERHPMTFDTFMNSESARKRYWARSYVGWSVIANAKPNPGHLVLAEAERRSMLSYLVTQNVDQLHQKAGSRNVLDLHGRLDEVVCMACGLEISREAVDRLLEKRNPQIEKFSPVEPSPDGDVDIEAPESFAAPQCPNCDGILKPNVVFFGESIPKPRIEQSMALLEDSRALVVAGSSLAVNSGMRLARKAKQLDVPIVIINLGPTKADELATLKINGSTSSVLGEIFLD